MNTIRFYNILKTAGLSVAALIMASISSRQLPVYVMRGGDRDTGLPCQRAVSFAVILRSPGPPKEKDAG